MAKGKVYHHYDCDAYTYSNNLQRLPLLVLLLVLILLLMIII